MSAEPKDRALAFCADGGVPLYECYCADLIGGKGGTRTLDPCIMSRVDVMWR